MLREGQIAAGTIERVAEGEVKNGDSACRCRPTREDNRGSRK
jgi:hypothetical protein